MSSTLRNLAREPNANIVVKAWLDWHNYISTQLMTEAQVSDRILKSMQGPGLKHKEMREAIAKGFAAARKKLEPESAPALNSESVAAEDEIPLPRHGLAEARVIARSRRSLWAVRLGFTRGERS